MTGIGSFFIVMMIVLTNLMTDFMRDRMQIRHAQAHTQKGDEQKQQSKQTSHSRKLLRDCHLSRRNSEYSRSAITMRLLQKASMGTISSFVQHWSDGVKCAQEFRYLLRLFVGDVASLAGIGLIVE